MPPRNVKHPHPSSLSAAMVACLDYARTVHNRSVDHVADLMGLPNKWRIYKWVEHADLPARYLRGFEHACGADFVTAYLAHSAHRLLIDIPHGRHVEANDMHALQKTTTAAVGALIAFAEGRTDTAETIAAITAAMEGLAWHRANVEKYQQPELELDA